ncbi:hypothetical protein C8R47DRAFT_1107536 [Mycena vitilis]|nr:hypothetical protein C8R47DRAFT_1107536 [Mycena vitilis]
MESLATAFSRLQINYQFQTANYVLFIYDHILTFSEEVDKMWTQPLTLASLLFYLNRYMTHGQFIILQVAFFETTWSVSMCERYVKFPGATTLCLVTIAELTLILRVYALYLSSKRVLIFLLSALMTQIILMAWALHFGIRTPLPPGFPGCVLTAIDPFFGAFWAAPIATDTCIFLLTLWRTIRYQRRHGKITSMDIILRDGIMYFFVIFGVNLMNCLIYFIAPPDLKAMGASFSQIMTAIMISRLHLNLRRTSGSMNSTMLPAMQFAARSALGGSTLAQDETPIAEKSFFTVGNLGGDLQGTFFADEDPEVDQVEEAGIELQDIRE